jgi:hypothetical protein
MKPGHIGPAHMLRLRLMDGCPSAPSKVGTVDFGWRCDSYALSKTRKGRCSRCCPVQGCWRFAQELDNSFLRFNNRPCILANLLAGGSCLAGGIVLLSNAAQRRNGSGQNRAVSGGWFAR